MPGVAYIYELADTYRDTLKVVELMTENQAKDQITQWWESRRWKYNLGLIAAGILDLFCMHSLVLSTLIMPYDQEFEITLFTIIFQGLAI